ncbi:MAG: MFS transporter [Candidatus Latescibacterota bacterium]|jgi:hypothetical protein
MVAADLFSSLLVRALLFSADIGNNIPLLYAVIVGLAAISPLKKPARLALIPHLVPREQLVSANSLMLATQQAASALGFAASGILILQLSLPTLIAINLSSFILTAIAVLLISLPSGEIKRAQHTNEPLWQSIRAGLRYLRGHALARHLVVMEILEHMPHGIWNSALMLVFTQQALNADAWGYQNGVHYVTTILWDEYRQRVPWRLNSFLWRQGCSLPIWPTRSVYAGSI